MSRPAGASLRLARFGFRDITAAARLLGPEPDGLGLWDESGGGPVEPGGTDVLAALGAGADPSLALHQLHRLAEAARSRTADDPIAAMRAEPGLRDALAAVLGASHTLGDDLVADPGRWAALREGPQPLAAAATPAELRT